MIMDDTKSVSLRLSRSHKSLQENEMNQKGRLCKLIEDKSCLYSRREQLNSPKYIQSSKKPVVIQEKYFPTRGCTQFKYMKTYPSTFLFQPQDDFLYDPNLKPMGPLGPWATGKVRFDIEGGLIGLRPVVDRYSITTFSEGQWRKQNMETLKKPVAIHQRNQKNENETITLLEQSSKEIQNLQDESTKQLQEREKEMEEHEIMLQKAINDMIEEISILDEERIKLKKSLVVLKLPEAIAGECLDRRASQPEPELIKDEVEEQLIKELAQIAEIHRNLNKKLEQIEDQLVENKTAQSKLEYDWNNKKDAIDIEKRNIALDNYSTIIMYKSGATKLSPLQSSLQYWNYFTKEILESCENTRKKSVALRSTLTNILENAVRDLQLFADAVDDALQRKIHTLQDTAKYLKEKLILTLENLVQTENRIENIKSTIDNLQQSLKLAQTRLYNRKLRISVENTFDKPQKALIYEIEIIQNNLEKIQSTLIESENIKNELIVTRGTLEREISLKHRSLTLHKERLQLLRSYFPSKSAILGLAEM